jgi:hypothetical protein
MHAFSRLVGEVHPEAELTYMSRSIGEFCEVLG